MYDHLKYIRISAQQFSVPSDGSLEFQSEMTATTPGTEPARFVHGCLGYRTTDITGTGGWDGQASTCPPGDEWSHTVSEGQQAGVVMNMIDFATGQLFDWFVSEHEAFALIERLPTNVTGGGDVGLDRAYTQIIKRTPIDGTVPHKFSIRYTRNPQGLSKVEYFINGRLFTSVDRVGIPLDRRTPAFPYTGYAPSLGPGEPLSIDSFAIGHGLFSLLDAFPYQHPDLPLADSVSIPVSERVFGQGAIGSFGKFTVTSRPAR